MYVNIFTRLEESYEINRNREFESLFSKLDIYGRNRRLVAEGYAGCMSRDILFGQQERAAAIKAISCLEYQLLETYMTNEDMKSFLDKAKNAARKTASNAIDLTKKGIEKAGNAVKSIAELLKTLPQRIRTAVEFIEKVLKSGISKASEFVKFVAGLFARLGDSLKEAVLSFGVFNSEKVVDSAPDMLRGKLSKLHETDKVSDATFNYVLEYVFARCKDGSYKKLNEEAAGDYEDSTQKLDNWFLSHKDEWTEKSKSNFLFRTFISGTNAKGERLGFFRVLLYSIIGSFIVCTLVPLVASSVFGLAGTGLVILVIACKALWMVKNVMRIIVNRTLTYKQSFKYKNGIVKHSHLFDLRTVLCLAIAVLTPTLFYIYADQINDWFHSLFHTDKDIPAEISQHDEPEAIEKAIDEVVVNPAPEIPKPSVPVVPDGPKVEDVNTEDMMLAIAETKPLEIDPLEPTTIAPPEGDVIVATLPDLEPKLEMPETVNADEVKEVVDTMQNQITDSNVQGSINQYAITNTGSGDVTINNNEVVNVYNGTMARTGGSATGVVVLHDYGRPVQFVNHVHGCGGRVIYASGHTYGVRIPPHGGHYPRFGATGHPHPIVHTAGHAHGPHPGGHMEYDLNYKGHGHHGFGSGHSPHGSGGPKPGFGVNSRVVSGSRPPVSHHGGSGSRPMFGGPRGRR